MKPLQNLDRIYRCAANLDRNAHRPFTVRIQFEESNGALLVAERRPAYVNHIFQSFQVDRAVDAQVFPRTIRYIANQLYVDSDGSIYHGRIDPRDYAVGQAVVGVDGGRLPQLDIACL